MARTLHYNIKRDKGSFTKKELNILFEISSHYNSDEFLEDINQAFGTSLEEIWTCESFWIGIGRFYPNWKRFEGKERESIYREIDEKITYLKQEITEVEAIIKLKEQGLIVFLDENYRNELSGFTKVQGNEFNALLVFKALVEISKKIPQATIELSDEGRFLICDLKIKNGLALPNIQQKIKNIDNFSKRILLSKNYEGNILNHLKNLNFRTEIFKEELRIDGLYSETFLKRIDDELQDIQIIESVLMDDVKETYELYFYNIANRNSKNWFNPKKFTRNVVVESFLNYKTSVPTLMEGFEGEGFGLSDKDSESESYKMLEYIFKTLESVGYDRKNVKTLDGE